MNDNFNSGKQPNRPDHRFERARTDRAAGITSRPDRFAFWALCLALVAMFAGVASADGASGGIGAGSDGAKGNDGATSRKAVNAKYARIWRKQSRKAKRWARRTSKCESGHDPKALGEGGKYRGAFQFLRSTWEAARRSPGGDPIRYRWKTQAVVAIAHRREARQKGWPSPWPRYRKNCRTR